MYCSHCGIQNQLQPMIIIFDGSTENSLGNLAVLIHTPDHTAHLTFEKDVLILGVSVLIGLCDVCDSEIVLYYVLKNSTRKLLDWLFHTRDKQGPESQEVKICHNFFSSSNREFSFSFYQTLLIFYLIWLKDSIYEQSQTELRQIIDNMVSTCLACMYYST